MFCNYCHKPDCCGGCKPAMYDCMFDLQVDPYDPSKWLVTLNGMMHRVNAPKLNETDTTLSTNYGTATLNYTAERHTDKITGRQLGEIINLDDLRDVVIDDTLDGNCYELIYRKWNNCGDGCKSAADEWRNFNINSDGARNDHIRYVRGANVNGCPQYLEVPTRTNEYWFGMWDTQGFTYVQAVPGTLPEDEDGNPIVMSVDPTTKKPILGTIQMPDLECLATNLINAIKPFAGDGRFIDLESGQITPSGASTPGFGGTFNPNTGAFEVHWSDWEGTTFTENDRLANGSLTGTITATTSFDYQTGNMTYTITSIHYDRINYSIIRTGTSPNPLTLTIWGAFPGTNLQGDKSALTAAGYRIFGPNTVYVHVGNSYTATINKTFTGTKTFTISANGGAGEWFDIVRVFNDWVDADDDGVVQGRYRNPLNWAEC